MGNLAALQETEHEASSRSATAQAAAAEAVSLNTSVERGRQNLMSLQEELVNAQVG